MIVLFGNGLANIGRKFDRLLLVRHHHDASGVGIALGTDQPDDVQPGRDAWDVGLAPFRGRHPAVMAGWIAARRQAMAETFAARRWDGRRLALLASLGIEQLTGWRPFEYRNYVEV